MTLWNDYHLPLSVDQALALLAAYEGRARVVAGGTDLLLEMQQGRKPPVAALVDITRIPEMTRLSEQAGEFRLGAALTHTAIVASELLARQATCLVESCGVIGGPQVRNVATLGGNVAHALPAGDGTIALVALDAEAEVAALQPSGLRRDWRPIRSLFAGPGKSAVDPYHELIVQFRFKAAHSEQGEATAFKRIMRPQGVALPILNLAVWLKLESGVVADARLALGPAGATPLRAVAAESYLRGKPFEAATVQAAAAQVLKEAQLRTSPHRATAEYRAALIPVLIERAITLAYRRAATGVVEPEGLGDTSYFSARAAARASRRVRAAWRAALPVT